MLKNDSSLKEKFAAEIKRLTGDENKDSKEALAEAIRTVFGLELTQKELEPLMQEETHR